MLICALPDPPTSREAELAAQLARASADHAKLCEQSARIGGELVSARSENKLLREKIDALLRRLFGAQSESSGAR